MTALVKAGGVLKQPFEPSQFVIEFWTRLGITIGQIEAADDHAAHCSFEIATVGVVFTAREATPNFERVQPFGENGHAVPRGLSVPDGSVTRRAEVVDRKCRIGRLQFLQTGHIRPFPFQPFEQRRQSGADAVDIESGDFKDIHEVRLGVTAAAVQPAAQ